MSHGSAEEAILRSLPVLRAPEGGRYLACGRYWEFVRTTEHLVVCEDLADAPQAHDRRDMVWRMVVLHVGQTEALAQADRTEPVDEVAVRLASVTD